MTTINSAPATGKVSKTSLLLRLLLLFAGTFLFVFIGSWIWDAFSSLVERQTTESAAISQPSINLDPKIEKDLAKVLETDEATQNTADIRNPFIDDGGISNESKAINNTGNPSTAAAETTNNGNTQTNNRNNTIVAGSRQNTPNRINGGAGTTNTTQNTEVPKPVEDTLARILKRDEIIRQGGDGGAESSVFAVQDLLPVGRVSGGNGAEEVIFYSQSADKTFSYPIGTQFFDGWLTELRQEGVIFSLYQDGRKITRFISWVRDVKSRAKQNLATNVPTTGTVSVMGNE